MLIPNGPCFLARLGLCVLLALVASSEALSPDAAAKLAKPGLRSPLDTQDSVNYEGLSPLPISTDDDPLPPPSDFFVEEPSSGAQPTATVDDLPVAPDRSSLIQMTAPKTFLRNRALVPAHATSVEDTLSGSVPNVDPTSDVQVDAAYAVVATSTDDELSGSGSSDGTAPVMLQGNFVDSGSTYGAAPSMSHTTSSNNGAAAFMFVKPASATPRMAPAVVQHISGDVGAASSMTMLARLTQMASENAQLVAKVSTLQEQNGISQHGQPLPVYEEPTFAHESEAKAQQKLLGELVHEVATLRKEVDRSPNRHMWRMHGGTASTSEDDSTDTETSIPTVDEDTTTYSMIAFLAPMVLQMCLLLSACSCVYHNNSWLHMGYKDAFWVCLALAFLDFLWTVLCLTGWMDSYVKQGLLIGAIAVLVSANLAVAGVLVYHWFNKSAVGRGFQFVETKVRKNVKTFEEDVLVCVQKVDEIYQNTPGIKKGLKKYFQNEGEWESEDEGDPSFKDNPPPAADHALKLGYIKVTIMSAQGLLECDGGLGVAWKNMTTFSDRWRAGSDPYCSVVMRGRKDACWHKTGYKKGHLDPDWTGKNNIVEISDFRKGDVLKFKVWDDDSHDLHVGIAHDDFLGKINLSSAEVMKMLDKGPKDFPLRDEKADQENRKGDNGAKGMKPKVEITRIATDLGVANPFGSIRLRIDSDKSSFRGWLTSEKNSVIAEEEFIKKNHRCC